MEKLKFSRENVSKIHPLHFRVEVLENIFSLLFLTNDDMQMMDFTGNVSIV